MLINWAKTAATHNQLYQPLYNILLALVPDNLMKGEFEMMVGLHVTDIVSKA